MPINVPSLPIPASHAQRRIVSTAGQPLFDSPASIVQTGNSSLPRIAAAKGCVLLSQIRRGLKKTSPKSLAISLMPGNFCVICTILLKVPNENSIFSAMIFTISPHQKKTAAGTRSGKKKRKMTHAIVRAAETRSGNIMLVSN